ncbi:MAG: hypothetical protein V7724_09750 [Sediminicola sp.]
MRTLLTILALPLAFLSCNNDDDSATSDCGTTACTQEFRTLVVTITDSEDLAVALDEYRVTEVATGKDITIESADHQWDQYRENGEYPLFSDAYSQIYQNQEVGIRFIGYIDGEEVVRADYTVGADCCHIFLVDGDTTLEIDG